MLTLAIFWTVVALVSAQRAEGDAKYMLFENKELASSKNLIKTLNVPLQVCACALQLNALGHMSCSGFVSVRPRNSIASLVCFSIEEFSMILAENERLILSSLNISKAFFYRV